MFQNMANYIWKRKKNGYNPEERSKAHLNIVKYEEQKNKIK